MAVNCSLVPGCFAGTGLRFSVPLVSGAGGVLIVLDFDSRACLKDAERKGNAYA